MTNLIKAELFKLRKRSMSLVLLLILIAISVLFMTLIQAVIRNDISTTTTSNTYNSSGATTVTPSTPVITQADPSTINLLDKIYSAAMSIIGNFGVVLAVVLIASSFGNEYSWQTIRPYLLCCESRAKMFTAKLIAVGIYIVAGMLVTILTTAIMGVIFTAVRGYSWNMSFFTLSYAGNGLLTFIRTFYITLPYILVAFFITVMARSAAAGIGFGIGILFLETIISALLKQISGWVSHVPDYLFNLNVQAINNLSDSSAKISISGSGSTSLPTPLHAFIVLAVYIIAFVSVSYYLFQKRDVTV
jgi:ABC-2 type transport system permease protein